MRFRRVVVGCMALGLSFPPVSLSALQEQAIAVPFPLTRLSAEAHLIFCNAVLGASLTARSDQHELVRIGVAKAGLNAKAYHATDRLVVEIGEGELYMFRRDEFEAGKATRVFPHTIIERTDSRLVAMATGLAPPRGASVFTLNLDTGLASWTSVESVAILSDSPRVEALYLTCGGRKD